MSGLLDNGLQIISRLLGKAPLKCNQVLNVLGNIFTVYIVLFTA